MKIEIEINVDRNVDLEDLVSMIAKAVTYGECESFYKYLTKLRLNSLYGAMNNFDKDK